MRTLQDTQANHFLLNEYTSLKGGVLIKSTNSVIKMTRTMVCELKNFQKKSCGISKYDKRNFTPQISSIFHFDRVRDGQMAHVLGVT